MYHFKKKKQGTNMKQMPDRAPRVEKKQKTLGNAEGSNLDIESPESYHGYMTLRKTALSFSGILNLSHSIQIIVFGLILDTKNLRRFLLHLMPFSLLVTVVHFGSTSILNCTRTAFITFHSQRSLNDKFISSPVVHFF